MMSSAVSADPVVVTGATGYIAGNIIDLLIRKGYSVRGTVRSLTDDKSLQLQKDFPSLQLHQADLLQDGSFHSAIDGCRFVIHTASPFQRTWKDAQKDFIEPAVQGTANVVSAALSTPSVQRIVLTSSCATIFDHSGATGDVPKTEKDWSTTTSLQAPYAHSKVLAERKAWQLVDDHNAAHPEHPVRLITVLPSLVIGPPVGSRVDGVSVSTVVNVLNESLLDTGVAPYAIPTVDVRDVAAAHVAAIELDHAKGRYVVSCLDPTTPLDFVPYLKQRLPSISYPTKLSGPVTVARYRVDARHTTQELGIDLIPIDRSLHDMADKLVQLGLVKGEVAK